MSLIYSRSPNELLIFTWRLHYLRAVVFQYDHTSYQKLVDIQVDKKAAKSGEGKDHTNLSCRLVRPEDSGKQLQDLAVLVDDPSLLSCLITRTGASFSFGELLNDLKVAFMEEKKKLKKLALQSDKLPAPEDDFMGKSKIKQYC